MTARSFSIPTILPLTTDPSCKLPWVNDSSSSLAKSSRDGVATLAAVAMDSPVGGCGPAATHTVLTQARSTYVDVHLRNGCRARRPSDRSDDSGPDARHQGSGRSRLGPPRRKRGQPRFRPARTASTMSMAARNVADIAEEARPGKGEGVAGRARAAGRPVILEAEPVEPAAGQPPERPGSLPKGCRVCPA